MFVVAFTECELTLALVAPQQPLRTYIWPDWSHLYQHIYSSLFILFPRDNFSSESPAPLTVSNTCSLKTYLYNLQPYTPLVYVQPSLSCVAIHTEESNFFCLRHLSFLQ